MKQTALILLAIVLVAVVVCAVLVSTLPRARVTIRAIGSTGELYTYTNELGSKVSMTLWRFAVTNAGPAAAMWYVDVELKEAKGPEQSISSLEKASRYVPLNPYQQSVLSLTVPAENDRAWRGAVTYFPRPNSMTWKLWNLTSHVPQLRRFFPWESFRTYHDAWHTTTTVTAAR